MFDTLYFELESYDSRCMFAKDYHERYAYSNHELLILSDNIFLHEFLNDLNQSFAFLQLPLKMSEQEAHGDLYVYTKKRKCFFHNIIIHLFILQRLIYMFLFLSEQGPPAEDIAESQEGQVHITPI